MYRKICISELGCRRKKCKSKNPPPSSKKHSGHEATASTVLNSSVPGSMITPDISPLPRHSKELTNAKTCSHSQNQLVIFLSSPKDLKDPLNSNSVGEGATTTAKELPDVEILRSSPKKPRKRRQSASPDHHQSRLRTPTKNTPVRDKSIGHTPRKDTPSKKRIKYQCRNPGCTDFLANLKSRERHETTYCRFRPDIEPTVSIENQLTVPVSVVISHV